MENKGDSANSGLIKSVQKSLKILKYIMDSDSEVSLTDMEKDLGYNISTTHRLLKTLIEERFISQNKITKKYDIGPEIFFSWLGERKPEKYFYRVTPILEECAKRTGETTNLFIRDGNEAVCITGCESQHTLRAFLMIGRRVPLTCTAAGKAFLSHIKEEELAKLISKIEFKQYLPNTLMDINSLLKDIDTSRQRGYTIENNEYEQTVTAVGVPVFDHNGRVICTISTIAPSTRLDEEKLNSISRELMLASKKITEIMGEVFY